MHFLMKKDSVRSFVKHETGQGQVQNSQEDSARSLKIPQLCELQIEEVRPHRHEN